MTCQIVTRPDVSFQLSSMRCGVIRGKCNRLHLQKVAAGQVGHWGDSAKQQESSANEFPYTQSVILFNSS